MGADFAQAQLRKARVLVTRAHFARQDIAALGFPAAAFGAICSYCAIIHVPRREHAGILRKFHRLLKPSGPDLACMGAEDLPEEREEDYFGTRMYGSHVDADTNVRLIRAGGFAAIFSQVEGDDLQPGSGRLFVTAQKLPG